MCMDYYVLCTNYVVCMCIFFTLLCLLATTRNPCVALQRQRSIGNYEVAFVGPTFHKSLAVMTVTCLCASSIFFLSKCNSLLLFHYQWRIQSWSQGGGWFPSHKFKCLFTVARRPTTFAVMTVVYRMHGHYVKTDFYVTI